MTFSIRRAEQRVLNDPEKVLLQWVNAQLEASGYTRRLRDFRGGLKDGELLLHLLRQIAPKKTQISFRALQVIYALYRTKLA